MPVARDLPVPGARAGSDPRSAHPAPRFTGESAQSRADAEHTRVRASTGCSQQLHQRLPARKDNVAPLRRSVVAFAARCGATDRQLDDIALAVSEALSNAVLHAYLHHARPGAIEVRALASERSLEVCVSDEGSGLAAREDSPGAGLGLALIRRVSDHFELVETTPGLCAQMTFAIT